MKKLTLSLLFLVIWTVVGVAMLPANTKPQAVVATQATTTAGSTVGADQQCNQEGLFARIECLKRVAAANRAKHCAKMKELGAPSEFCK